MGLEGQVVLITGGSRGIGRAIALRLARERPRHLFIGYCSNHQAARQTVADLAALEVEATAVRTEVGREELLREMFDQVRERAGRLDVFVSNAARTAWSPALELSARSWQRTMDINARAFLLGAQMAAGLMRDNGGGGGGGRIIGLSSLGSRYAVPQYVALGVAKAAIEALTRYLAVELAPLGINVNVVCGGFIDTDSTRLLPEHRQAVEQVASRTPAGRIGQPDDLAGVVAFLCSRDSDWIRGQTLLADGGYSLVS